MTEHVWPVIPVRRILASLQGSVVHMKRNAEHAIGQPCRADICHGQQLAFGLFANLPWALVGHVSSWKGCQADQVY